MNVVNPNDIISNINQNNMYTNGTYIIDNMIHDLQNIQVRFQEMITQNIHMLETLIQMEKEKEQQQSHINQEQQSYINQEIQYPDTIFMNDSEY